MKVLLGVGGTESSVEALERVVARTEGTGDDLTIAIYQSPDADATLEEIETTVRDVLAEYDVEVEVRRAEGDPGACLVDMAETEGFDRIALGGGERSPMGKIRIESVTEFVLLNSHITVSLIR